MLEKRLALDTEAAQAPPECSAWSRQEISHLSQNRCWRADPSSHLGCFSVSLDGSFCGLQLWVGSRLKVGDCAPLPLRPPSRGQDVGSRELARGITCTAHTPAPLCGPERQLELSSLVDRATEVQTSLKTASPWWWKDLAWAYLTLSSHLTKVPRPLVLRFRPTQQHPGETRPGPWAPLF